MTQRSVELLGDSKQAVIVVFFQCKSNNKLYIQALRRTESILINPQLWFCCKEGWSVITLQSPLSNLFHKTWIMTSIQQRRNAESIQLEGFCVTLIKIHHYQSIWQCFTDYIFLHLAFCRILRLRIYFPQTTLSGFVSVRAEQASLSSSEAQADSGKLGWTSYSGSVSLNHESGSVPVWAERFSHSTNVRQSVTSSPAGVMG